MIKEDRRPWISPQGSHPAAISPATQLGYWIRRAYAGVDPSRAYSQAVLYNLSLETFARSQFERIWLRHYGLSGMFESHRHAASKIDRVHLIIPYHESDEKPTCLASWLNGRHLFGLVSDLARDKSLRDRARPVLTKTWVGFVECPRTQPTPKESTGQTSQVQGDYAFAFYFSLPIGPEDVREKAQKDFNRLLDRNAAANVFARSKLAKYTRSLLGAGVSEPFSERLNGYCSYRYLIPIADRATAGARRPAELCGITQHVSLLGRIWDNTKSPLHLCPCHDIDPLMEAECVNDKFIRLDAFLAWAVLALSEDKATGLYTVSDQPVSIRSL